MTARCASLKPFDRIRAARKRIGIRCGPLRGDDPAKRTHHERAKQTDTFLDALSKESRR